MRKRLIRNESIEVRRSKKNGYGVFAKDDIGEGEILEECRLIFIPLNYKVETLDRYLWGWDPDDPMRSMALPIGYGSLYNSSNGKTPSVCISADEEDQIIIFIANKNIKKNEELTMDYKYYEDAKYYTKIEPPNKKEVEMLMNGYGGDDRSELIEKNFPGGPIA